MTSRTKLFAVALPALSLGGCYVLPVAPDGSPVYPLPAYAAPVAGPVVAAPVAGAAPPAVVTARLYPANEVAARTGMLTGTVTNLLTGKGRFQLDFRGEILIGEATRVHGEDKRGIANAYGDRGTYMNCQYRMTTPQQGAGICAFSSGEKYSVHIGS